MILILKTNLLFDDVLMYNYLSTYKYFYVFQLRFVPRIYHRIPKNCHKFFKSTEHPVFANAISYFQVIIFYYRFAIKNVPIRIFMFLFH